jgi:hypothetical protein
MISKDFPFVLTGNYSVGGTSGGGGGGTINGTIQSTQVAFGTAVDTIGGDANFTFDTTNQLLDVEKIKAQVIIQIRNETGSTINAGSVVYVSADGSSIPLVSLADASDSAKMPSVAIVSNSINTGNNGYGVLTGTINGLDGSAGNTVFDSTITASDVGRTVYVSPTNAGRLTITKPTGSTQLIQNVGRIIDITGNNVKISVSNIGRSNDVPNSFSTTGNIDAGSLTVNSAYTFPTSDGSANQILITDGLGNLSFTNQSSSTSIEISGTADETISIGDVVRFVLNGEAGLTAGRIVKANASSPSTADIIGIASSSSTQGNPINFIPNGQTAVNFGSAPATTDLGKNVYLSTTSGIATLTIPTAVGESVIRIGKLSSADGVSTSVNCVLNIEYIIDL